MRKLNISSCDLMTNAQEEKQATKKSANKQRQLKKPVEVFIPTFDTGEPLRIGDRFHIGVSRPLTALGFSISDSATYVTTLENGELKIEHPVSHKPVDSLEAIKSDSELGAAKYCKNIGIELLDNKADTRWRAMLESIMARIIAIYESELSKKENELQSLKQGIEACELQIAEINKSNSPELIISDSLQQDNKEVQ